MIETKKPFANNSTSTVREKDIINDGNNSSPGIDQELSRDNSTQIEPKIAENIISKANKNIKHESYKLAQLGCRKLL